MRKGSWLNHPDVPKLRTLYCGDTPLEDFTIHDKALIKCENCGTPALKSIHLWLRGVHRHACCRRFHRANPKDATEIQCCVCLEIKSINDFPVKHLPTGPSYRTTCKQCRSAYRLERWHADRNADPMGAWAQVVYRSSQYRAQTKGVPHTLTVDEIIACVDKTCAFCNKPMQFNLKRGDLADCVSLDRLIPSAGYVRENVVVICYRCNSIKTDATLLELETVAAGLRRELEKRGILGVSSQASELTQEDPQQEDDRSTV